MELLSGISTSPPPETSPPRPSSALPSSALPSSGGSGLRLARSLKTGDPPSRLESTLQTIRSTLHDFKASVEQRMDASVAINAAVLRSSAASLDSQRALVSESQSQLEARLQASLLSSTAAMQMQAGSIEALRHALPQMEARLEATIARTSSALLAQSDAIDALRFSFAETEARLHKTLKATVVSALRDGVREHAEGGEQDGGYADSYEEEEARPPTLDDATLRGRQLWNEPSDIDAARHRGEWGSYPCGHSIALSRSQADLDQFADRARREAEELRQLQEKGRVQPHHQGGERPYDQHRQAGVDSSRRQKELDRIKQDGATWASRETAEDMRKRHGEVESQREREAARDRLRQEGERSWREREEGESALQRGSAVAEREKRLQEEEKDRVLREERARLRREEERGLREEERARFLREEDRARLRREEEKEILLREEERARILKEEEKERFLREEERARILREEQRARMLREEEQERVLRGEEKARVLREEERARVLREDERARVLREENERFDERIREQERKAASRRIGRAARDRIRRRSPAVDSQLAIQHVSPLTCWIASCEPTAGDPACESSNTTRTSTQSSRRGGRHLGR